MSHKKLTPIEKRRTVFSRPVHIEPSTDSEITRCNECMQFIVQRLEAELPSLFPIDVFNNKEVDTQHSIDNINITSPLNNMRKSPGSIRVTDRMEAGITKMIPNEKVPTDKKPKRKFKLPVDIIILLCIPNDFSSINFIFSRSVSVEPTKF